MKSKTRLPGGRKLTLGVAAVCGVLLTPITPAGAAPGVLLSDDEPVAPGVTFRSFTWKTDHGSTQGYLLQADLTNPRVDLGLLHRESVTEPTAISALADGQKAVAGVNGDFFNNTDEHEGVTPTGSAVGAEIAAGHDRKAAVPDGQRFGPGLPDGTTTEDVFGLGVDRVARVGTVSLEGKIQTDQGVLGVDGLNQYALPVDGVGVFTSEWGSMSRLRSTCGTDTDRGAPCSDTTIEVVVNDGKVAEVHDKPGEGAIAEGDFVLVGREGGVGELDDLKPGDPVSVDYGLAPVGAPEYQAAVGGFPILRDGAALSDLDTEALAPRTSAGVSADGKHVFLVAMDGRSDVSVGLTVSELADLLKQLGADDAVNLDGGGSTTLVAREEGADRVTVRNNPSDGKERPVANGIGLFSK
ncbi:phosphodiester glycosidase family protein [Saccharopolyspora taberi]|uniref:Phosphodiester glycosidase domain-containing protein n=1 Tax=Saccharopolyspora taberi TaxID=60895 RepID=A0ABN3VG53_9PSEU